MFQEPHKFTYKTMMLMRCVLAICGQNLNYCADCNTSFHIDESVHCDDFVECPNCDNRWHSISVRDKQKIRGLA